MVLQHKKIAILPFRYVWFSEEPKFTFSTIYQKSYEKRKIPFTKREVVHTKEIDLTKPLDKIQEGFSKTNRYKIRRAEIRDQAIFSIEDNRKEAIDFCNVFSTWKNLPSVSENKFMFEEEHNFLITKASLKESGEVLARHYNILDPADKKVFMLYSATTTKGMEASKRRSLVSRVNRFLHAKEIAFFKKKGYELYDFGGYVVDTEDEKLKGINRFKDSFGGILVEQYTYFPMWMYWLKKLMVSTVKI